MAPASTNDVLNEVKAFLGDAATSKSDAEQLLRYIRDRPMTAVIETALPIDEMDERLEFITSAINAMNERVPLIDRRLTKFQMSVIFSLPLDRLRTLQRELHSEVPLAFGAFSRNAADLVQIFLLRGNRPNSTTASVRRDNGQSDMCLERDGKRCIIMGTLNPEVCHIIPFSANSSAERRHMLEDTYNVLESVVGDRATLLLGQPGSSDRSWNMICLNRQLHAWWGRGYFAFKCLGVTPVEVGGGDSGLPSIVELQFHWMPLQPTGKATDGQWMQDVPNDGRREWVRDWEQSPRYGGGGAVAAAHATTSRLVQTGHVICIAMPSLEDGLRMKSMIDIQWACIRMASMSGAAGDPEFIFHRRDWSERESEDPGSRIYGEWDEDGLDG